MSRIAVKKLKPRLSLSVQYACSEESLPVRAQLRRWVSAACLAANGADAFAEITLRFVDAEEGRVLNREYRGRGQASKDYATNVLSFPYAPAPQLAGDLVLCRPVVLREAQEQGKPLQAHVAHLVVHGMLHLQGFDHETDADAERMEVQERIILARFGFADPYAIEAIKNVI